jgi:hypothetical protein
MLQSSSSTNVMSAPWWSHRTLDPGRRLLKARVTPHATMRSGRAACICIRASSRDRIASPCLPASRLECCCGNAFPQHCLICRSTVSVRKSCTNKDPAAESTPSCGDRGIETTCCAKGKAIREEDHHTNRFSEPTGSARGAFAWRPLRAARSECKDEGSLWVNLAP